MSVQEQELVILKTVPKKGDSIEIAGLKGFVVDVIQNKPEYCEDLTREIIFDSNGFSYPRKKISSRPGNLTIEIQFQDTIF